MLGTVRHRACLQETYLKGEIRIFNRRLNNNNNNSHKRGIGDWGVFAAGLAVLLNDRATQAVRELVSKGARLAYPAKSWLGDWEAKKLNLALK